MADGVCYEDQENVQVPPMVTDFIDQMDDRKVRLYAKDLRRENNELSAMVNDYRQTIEEFGGEYLLARAEWRIAMRNLNRYHIEEATRMVETKKTVVEQTVRGENAVPEDPTGVR